MIAFKLKQLLRDVGWVYGFVIMFLVIAGLQTKVSVKLLTMDVFRQAEIPSYVGLLSNLGSLVWCGAFAVSIFSYVLLQKTEKYKTLAFILYSSVISLLLLLDDFFMLHERFYKTYFHLPDEKIVYVAYLVMIAVYLLNFRTIIAKTDYLLLILALVFFANSMSLDAIEQVLYSFPQLAPDPYFLAEDGSKLLGIVSWCIYMGRTCSYFVFSHLPSGNHCARAIQKSVSHQAENRCDE
jgi:hypothetical protein